MSKSVHYQIGMNTIMYCRPNICNTGIQRLNTLLKNDSSKTHSTLTMSVTALPVPNVIITPQFKTDYSLLLSVSHFVNTIYATDNFVVQILSKYEMPIGKYACKYCIYIRYDQQYWLLQHTTIINHENIHKPSQEISNSTAFLFWSSRDRKWQ